MADYCRPEVDTGVTSYRKVEGVEVVLETEFGDPSSNRLGAIKIPHFVTTATTTDDGDDDDGGAVYAITPKPTPLARA